MSLPAPPRGKAHSRVSLTPCPIANETPLAVPFKREPPRTPGKGALTLGQIFSPISDPTVLLTRLFPIDLYSSKKLMHTILVYEKIRIIVVLTLCCI